MQRKKILIVDDTDWNRDLLVQLLEDDYEIAQAVDGEEGVRQAAAERPRLVLLDLGMPVVGGGGAVEGGEGGREAAAGRPDLILMALGMPVMDGWEATRRIKADAELKHIPVI